MSVAFLAAKIFNMCNVVAQHQHSFREAVSIMVSLGLNNENVEPRKIEGHLAKGMRSRAKKSKIL